MKQVAQVSRGSRCRSHFISIYGYIGLYGGRKSANDLMDKDQIVGTAEQQVRGSHSFKLDGYDDVFSCVSDGSIEVSRCDSVRFSERL